MAIAVYAIAVFIAFYAPAIALGITFLMWVFWAVVTKDNDEDSE